MTDQQEEVPWNELPEGQWAGYNAHPAAAGDHYRHVPARNAAERAEYDQIEQQAAEVDEEHERYVHFNGEHVQDPPAHGEWCVDSCPYDTPEQARAREEARAFVEAREAEQAAEYAGVEAGS